MASANGDGGEGIVLYPLFGSRDDTLTRLQADLPDYAVIHRYEPLRGFVFIARRISGTGPVLVMTEDEDEMRELLGHRQRGR